MMKKSLILALEAGLAGGTVSILEKGSQIDYLNGSGILSRSEDLLMLFEQLLLRNGLKKNDVDLIVVSENPGSLTGLRIGLATAKGLTDALGAKLCRMSVLDALVTVSGKESKILAAIYTPMGEIFFREYILRNFQNKPVGSAESTKEPAAFAEMIEKFCRQGTHFVFNVELKTQLQKYPKVYGRLMDEQIYWAEGNFAELLGKAAHKLCV